MRFLDFEDDLSTVSPAWKNTRPDRTSGLIALQHKSGGAAWGSPTGILLRLG
jgi:hypothetical protein